MILPMLLVRLFVPHSSVTQRKMIRTGEALAGSCPIAGIRSKGLPDREEGNLMPFLA